MIVPVIVFFIAVLMICYETKHHGRSWPKVRGWWFRAILLNGAQVGTVYLAGLTWDKWLLQHQSWSLHSFGNTSGGFIGYLAITFFFYWWHRIRHKSNFLWRWIHQIHHSPKRLEIITAFYKHPFELIADSILSSAILYPLLGLNPIAATYAVLLSALAELFYHWNVKTPYWVGFIFQRPESHCVHHQDGLHSYNYADLPLWDMMFGTFYNPKHWDAKCGFGEKEHRLKEMLLGVDVYKTKKSSLKKRVATFSPALFLIGIGTLQITGDAVQSKGLKALAMATNASPAPKVFCTANSLETFSSTFTLEWKDLEGNANSLLLTPQLSARIKGPYNRRNVYGAILAYGPLLNANPHMKNLYESVLSFAVQNGAPLLRELGLNPNEIDGKLWICVHPRNEVPHLNLTKEVEIL